ncbi:MAG: hypothetical protein ACO1SV_14895 [Fimbriimonas sp.]
MKKNHLWIGAVLLGVFGLAGCDSGPSEATKEQEKAFDGGPMPESARKRMEEGLRNSGQKAAQDAAARARANAGG